MFQKPTYSGPTRWRMIRSQITISASRCERNSKMGDALGKGFPDPPPARRTLPVSAPGTRESIHLRIGLGLRAACCPFGIRSLLRSFLVVGIRRSRLRATKRQQAARSPRGRRTICDSLAATLAETPLQATHSSICSNNSFRIFLAESGMTVPGPKMAAAPF